MVSTFPAVGFGDVLTSDPTFGVPAFGTLVSPVLNVGIALEGYHARQLHWLRAFRADRSTGNARNLRWGFFRSHTLPPLLQAKSVSRLPTRGARPLSIIVPMYKREQSSVDVKRRTGCKIVHAYFCLGCCCCWATCWGATGVGGAVVRLSISSAWARASEASFSSSAADANPVSRALSAIANNRVARSRSLSESGMMCPPNRAAFRDINSEGSDGSEPSEIQKDHPRIQKEPAGIERGQYQSSNENIP
jgi:hypothetical protein